MRLCRYTGVLLIAAFLHPLSPLAAEEAGAPAAAGVVSAGFIYDKAPTPQCHASTLAETGDGLVAAWFGGTREKHPDVGIWVARRTDEVWSTPVEVANGLEPDGKRHPCWNPVLFQMPKGPLVLFYKVGPSPSTWWGMRIESTDGGKTWSTPERLPDDIAGPIKNKPILLDDGTLLCGSSTEDQGWRVHMEMTADGGKTWKRTSVLRADEKNQAIQPTILWHRGNKLQILCRPRSAGRILSSWSEDGGKNWSELSPIELPNPNSGIDAVTLKDGRHLLVYNHTPRGRSPLNVAVSNDGKTWEAAAVLESEPGEYSYPAVIQTADGKIHITYTWKRTKVRHVTLDPGQLVLRPIIGGKWPQ